MILDILQKLLVTMAVFLPLEYLLPRLKDKKVFRAKWSLDSCYALISPFIIGVGFVFIIVLGSLIINPILPARVTEVIASQHLIVQVIAIIIIADIGYYFVHRMFHEIPFLWKLHAVHHSIEEMDWLAAHRVHPIDQILTRGLSLIIPYTFGFSTESIAIFFVIFVWHSYLKHSNINIRFGLLRWILVSPTYHHWHHANEEDAFDKNYAGQLPIIDIIFKTAIMKETSGPAHYGTDTPVPESYIGQILLPFKLPKPKNKAASLKMEDVSLPGQ
ncbi:MAG: sterol desaturase family protein [Robiginitomaculum sp.]|nr:sterol desaturase family protein [Robiginitomaculum sp.]